MCPKLSCHDLSPFSHYSTLTSFMLLAMISRLMTLSLICTELQNIINQLHAGETCQGNTATTSNSVCPQLISLFSSSFLFPSSCTPCWDILMLSKSFKLKTLWSYLCLLSHPPSPFKFYSVSKFQLYFYNMSTLHSLPQPHYSCFKRYNCVLARFSNSTISIPTYILLPGQFS